MFWIPAAIGGLAVLAWWKKPWKKGLTSERKLIYENALKLVKDPAKLRDLAMSYQKVGLKKEAAMLNKRADYIELPPEVKAAHRAAFEKAMKSSDPDAIKKLAAAFATSGATITAATLNNYAKGLETAQKAK